MKDKIIGLRGIQSEDKRVELHFFVGGFYVFCFVFVFTDTVKRKETSQK